MTDAEKQPYKDREAMEPLRMDVPAGIDDDATSPQSPWGLGSSVFPCSADVIRKTTNTLLPMGRQWLRSAYDKCIAAQESESVARCVVPNTRTKLDQKLLLKQRKQSQTCWEAHAGLCVKDPNFSSIMSCHAALDRAIRSFSISPHDGDGQALFLFVGFTRKRAADDMQRRNVVAGITGDEFEVAMLSDQPERRRGWKTWTLCNFTIVERTFQVGSHIGLVQTDKLTLSECVSFAFVKRLRDRAKYWVACHLVYEDLEDSLHVMKASFRIIGYRYNIYIYIYIYIIIFFSNCVAHIKFVLTHMLPASLRTRRCMQLCASDIFGESHLAFRCDTGPGNYVLGI